MSEWNLHKAVILQENAGYNKGAGILYPLCMKSGCSHCYTGHEWETAQGRLCRKKQQQLDPQTRWLLKTAKSDHLHSSEFNLRGFMMYSS